MFEYGPNGVNESGSNYGNQLVAWFLPPRTGDLDLSGAAPASFNVTVSGVKDAAGNAMASATVNGDVSAMKAGDIGTPGTDPLLAGDAFAFGAGGFYSAGGGHDIWDAADEFAICVKDRPSHGAGWRIAARAPQGAREARALPRESCGKPG